MKKLIIIILLLAINSCNSQTKKTYLLNNNEKEICNKMNLDSTIIKELRHYNTNSIEIFHYSHSKMYSEGKVIELNPKKMNGLIFKETNRKSKPLVLKLKSKLKKVGYTIFLLEEHFNINNQKDIIAIVKTMDKYQILTQLETNGYNYDIDPKELQKIITKFDEKYDLELIGAAGDWCEFIINKKPDNWMSFAEEVYKICPDVVDQGTGTVKELAKEMKRSNRLYFWWD